MTLCAAWIREVGDSQELVFVTDSTLTGGEKWNHGVKLFELPRQDCLLCFAGETSRAYPLILNLTAAIKHNERLRNPKLDIADVLYSVADLFTELVKQIRDLPKGGDNADIGSEAKFLFGGWSWRENRFRIWQLQYATDAKAFIFIEATTGSRSRVCVFLGDPDDDQTSVAAEAKKRYSERFASYDVIDNRLDMEPLSIVSDISRKPEVYHVDGALQIGKVYRSGSNELFGVMWPSVKGDPHFLGKRYAKHAKPNVRYFDPDTSELIEEELPKSLANMADFEETEDIDFLRTCYAEEGNFIKATLSEKEREQLLGIFRERAYQDFKQKAEANPLTGNVPEPTHDEL
jgi:hypothetical protein